MVQQRIEVSEEGGITIVALTDKRYLGDPQIQETKDQLYALVDDQNKHRIIIDFHRVEYLSSLLLGGLITLKKKVGAAQGNLVLCGIDPAIYATFEVTKLDKFFTTVKDLHLALQKF